ncbi:MAG: LPS assembly protein LptD [Thermodesulfobacteriota bacterium]|nr:LPS assembly protein LptD [Thermodesulfobacteriota bacterium]
MEGAAQPVQEPAWKISADKMTRLGSPENVVAEGNVVLEPDQDEGGPPMVIKADWVRYNVRENTLDAHGNLSFYSETEEATAGDAYLKLDDDTAVFTDATLFVPESNLHFSSRRVEKTGELTYHFGRCTMTTCDTVEGKAPPWEFSAAEASLDLEGLAVLKHAVLRVKDIPVFYFPHMQYPANRNRRTGFLFPEMSQSTRSGTGMTVPFFVDLSPSADVTLYPGFMSKRGMVAGLEFRYVSDYGSKGAFAANYLDDRLEDDHDDDFKDDGFFRTEKDRYWLRGMMDHDFGDDLIARLDLDMVSDRDYLQEFDKSMIGFNASTERFEKMFDRGFMEQTVPFRESRLQLAKTWPSVFLGGEFIGVDDLHSEDYLETQTQTLPRIFFDGSLDIPATPVSLLWESEYDYFWREKGVGAHRLDVNPRLVSPLPFGRRLLEGTVSTGFHYTMYEVEDNGPSSLDWSGDTSPDRTAWDFNVNLGTTLAREFGLNLGSARWLDHAIRPQISYEYLDVSDDQEYPHFDSVDTLDDINQVNYEIKNDFLVGGTRDDGNDFVRYIGYFKIEQFYDIKEERRDLKGPDDEHQPFSDITFTLDVYPLPKLQTKYVTTYNVYGEGITSHDLLNRYTSSRGDTFALDYRYEKDSPIDELNASFRTRLTDTLFLEGDLIQSLEENETVESSIGLTYQPNCWSVKVMASHTPDDDQVFVVFSIVGFGKSLGFGMGAANEGMYGTSESEF